MPYRYLIFVTLTLLLIGFVSYSTLATARLLRTWKPEKNLLLLWPENILRLGMIGFAIGLGWLSGLPPEQLGWTVQNLNAQLWQGTLWGLGIAIFFYGSTRLFMNRSSERIYSTVIIEAIVPKNRREAWLVMLALGPSVFLEELLFRSLLLGGLEPILWLPVLLIGSAILFGLLHSPQGVWGMVGAGMAGLLFGWLFVRYGSLVVPTVAHYVANTVQIAFAMWLRR